MHKKYLVILLQNATPGEHMNSSADVYNKILQLPYDCLQFLCKIKIEHIVITDWGDESVQSSIMKLGIGF